MTVVHVATPRREFPTRNSQSSYSRLESPRGAESQRLEAAAAAPAESRRVARVGIGERAWRYGARLRFRIGTSRHSQDARHHSSQESGSEEQLDDWATHDGRADSRGSGHWTLSQWRLETSR